VGHRNAPLPDANDVYRATSHVGDRCSDIGDFYDRAASYPELTAAVTAAAGGDGGCGDGGSVLPVTALSAGLTLVHFSAQRKRFVWENRCHQGMFKGCLGGVYGVLGCIRGCLGCISCQIRLRLS